MDDAELQQSGPNEYYGRIVFPDLPLLSGRYYFNVVATDQENLQAYDISEQAEHFTISETGPDAGLTRLRHYWAGLR